MYISLIPQHVPHAPPIPQHVPHAPPISSLILIIRLLFGQKWTHKSRSYVLSLGVFYCVIPVWPLCLLLRHSRLAPELLLRHPVGPRCLLLRHPVGTQCLLLRHSRLAPVLLLRHPRYAPMSSIASSPLCPDVFLGDLSTNALNDVRLLTGDAKFHSHAKQHTKLRFCIL